MHQQLISEQSGYDSYYHGRYPGRHPGRYPGLHCHHYHCPRHPRRWSDQSRSTLLQERVLLHQRQLSALVEVVSFYS
jgi:hypothetical protein